MKINLSVPHFFGEEIKNLKKSVKKNGFHHLDLQVSILKKD